MNINFQKNEPPDIEPILIQLNGKTRDQWTVDDWIRWTSFLEDQGDYFMNEALRLLKENLSLEVTIRSLNDWMYKKLGLPKQRKFKGLLVRPRGRPRDIHRKEQQLQRGKTLLAAGKSWKELTEIFSREGLGSDTRTIRRMLKEKVN